MLLLPSGVCRPTLFDNKMEYLEELLLIRPSLDYADQILDYRKAFLDHSPTLDGCRHLRHCADPEAFIRRCERFLQVETLPEGGVLADQFFCVRKGDNALVGMIQVRRYLNEYLEKYAGHIGYSVRPDERRKGYASWMLKESLNYCKNQLGLREVSLFCNENNEGSRRTIRKNGGVLLGTVWEPDEEEMMEKYVISL